MRMRLSVLDQSLVSAGRSAAQAIRDTVALARECEDFGYRRFWVSEHHGNVAIAGSAPEVLLGALAMATSTMRIGSAGVMLPHYAPLKVAEQFRVLEALAPGRVDLGLGRGPGADRQTAYALKPGAIDNPFAMSTMDSFPTDVADAVTLALGQPLGDDHVFAGVVAQPLGPTGPQPWIVGSSLYSARLAGYLGLPFCHAYFFGDGSDAQKAVAAYRGNFTPSATLNEPLLGLCVFAMAAPTAAEAERLFLSYALWRLARDSGRTVPLPRQGKTVEGAAVPPREVLDLLREHTASGTADQVFWRLQTLEAELGVDEMVIVTPTHELSDRIRSYRLIAEISRSHTQDPHDETNLPAAAPADRSKQNS
ncbi:hypothetical protein Sa4125_02720 [Aureimonas sp. SA4125]|uniref:LLM class flavin-dependent oxidoreductase n=1 Tax=Aureimonas sp. SA4125 TaxID=2826993 RepID=UPI001CC37537|nr:LLM class flavin-dependent oxidoreductase [Aureimonas sp. SA4125]BDA82730.1 hypothetical protein Sa4125_02720 [Aureimonas sp. SA4125]